MLNEQLRAVNDAIWEAASRVGNNAPKVADAILENVFPRTCSAAQDEGAFAILRRGFIGHVSRILKSYPDDDKQRDFASIADEFGPFVKELKSASYYVESAQELVSVAGLIADPDLLDDARKHMRRKGEECLAEAERLDQLYFAVTATATRETEDLLSRVFV
jgi:hypothetical protein